MRNLPLHPTHHRRALFILAATVAALAAAGLAAACPFCSAVAPTLTEQFAEASTVVIAQLTERPEAPAGEEGFAPGLGEEIEPSKFRIVEVLKGGDLLGELEEIEAVYISEAKIGDRFLVTGIDGPPLIWGTPTRLTDKGRQYILDLMKLPAEGPERLAFFLDHLEGTDEMIMRDAYDEFAISSYDNLKAIAPQMDHGLIIQWLKNEDITPTRKSLYLTMLSVCGGQDDLPMLESMLKAEGFKTSLDATIGCYLALRGPEGIELVEELFLKDPGDEFVEVTAALRAVRLSYDEKIIDKETAIRAVRLLLDHPKYADLVLPDLARWQDWSLIDRVSDLFMNANEDNNYIRLSVLRYLRECPLPEAADKLAELEKVDPVAARQAKALLIPSTAAPAKVSGDDSNKNDDDDAKPSAALAKADDAALPPAQPESAKGPETNETAAAGSGPPSEQQASQAAVTAVAEPASSPGRARSSAPAESGGPDWVVWMLIGVALVMLGYGIVVARRRPSASARSS